MFRHVLGFDIIRKLTSSTAFSLANANDARIAASLGRFLEQLVSIAAVLLKASDLESMSELLGTLQSCELRPSNKLMRSPDSVFSIRSSKFQAVSDASFARRHPRSIREQVSRGVGMRRYSAMEWTLACLSPCLARTCLPRSEHTVNSFPPLKSRQIRIMTALVACISMIASTLIQAGRLDEAEQALQSEGGCDARVLLLRYEIDLARGDVAKGTLSSFSIVPRLTF